MLISADHHFLGVFERKLRSLFMLENLLRSFKFTLPLGVLVFSFFIKLGDVFGIQLFGQASDWKVLRPSAASCCFSPC